MQSCALEMYCGFIKTVLIKSSGFIYLLIYFNYLVVIIIIIIIISSSSSSSSSILLSLRQQLVNPTCIKCRGFLAACFIYLSIFFIIYSLFITPLQPPFQFVLSLAQAKHSFRWLYNLIKSAFNIKLEFKSTQTYRCQNCAGELIYSFLKPASS